MLLRHCRHDTARPIGAPFSRHNGPHGIAPRLKRMPTVRLALVMVLLAVLIVMIGTSLMEYGSGSDYQSGLRYGLLTWAVILSIYAIRKVTRGPDE